MNLTLGELGGGGFGSQASSGGFGSGGGFGRGRGGDAPKMNGFGGSDSWESNNNVGEKKGGFGGRGGGGFGGKSYSKIRS